MNNVKFHLSNHINLKWSDLKTEEAEYSSCKVLCCTSLLFLQKENLHSNLDKFLPPDRMEVSLPGQMAFYLDSEERAFPSSVDSIPRNGTT